MYQTVSRVGQKFLGKAKLFKYAFNLSPMYRRSTGRITSVTDDLLKVNIKIPLSWKNANYVGTIFGGSLFSATDPIYMVQLLNILDENYVVWDKSSEIKFRRPAKKAGYATFEFTADEIAQIKNDVAEKNEIELIKSVDITGPNDEVYCQVTKVLYVANKTFYREKRKKKKTEKS